MKVSDFVVDWSGQNRKVNVDSAVKKIKRFGGNVCSKFDGRI